MALNSINPFTHDAQAQRDGRIASILWNKDVRDKKDLRSPEEIFPYLKQGTPDWLEHEDVKKAKSLLIAARNSFGGMVNESGVKLIKQKIKEQIEIESKKKKVDLYLISELETLLTS